MHTQEFWKNQCPSLSIDAVFPPEKAKATVADQWLEEERIRLTRDNAAAFANIFQASLTEKIKIAAGDLRKSGMPAGALTLFDEFWDMVTALQPVAQRLLGEDYKFAGNFLIQYLDEPENLKAKRGGSLFRVTLTEADIRFAVEFIPLSKMPAGVSAKRSSYIPSFQERLAALRVTHFLNSAFRSLISQ